VNQEGGLQGHLGCHVQEILYYGYFQ
jgi:hypothetical protein